MANSSVAEIQVSTAAVTGALLWAPTGTALPTNSTTALAAGFKNLGYVNEDGIVPAREVSSDPIRDMNGAQLRVVQTEFSKSYTATLYQVNNEDLNNMIFGDGNVTVTAPGPSAGTLLAVLDKGLLSTAGVLVIETQDGLARHRRVVPVAQVTAVEEGPLVGRAVRSFGITWSSSPDSSGVYDYVYNTDGVFAP